VSKKFDWDKARQYRESKVKAGTVLPNGRRVPWLPPRDDLQRKADAALKQWLATLGPRDRRGLA
jgi:hypothetical protein